MNEIDSLDFWHAEVRAAYYDLAAHLTFLKLRAELRAFGDLLEEKYRPDQPRAPKGTPEGGRWVADAGSARQGLGGGQVRVAQTDILGRYGVDLRAEEARGGHTMEDHVGKSPNSLIRRIYRERYDGFLYSAGRRRAGSFGSLLTATRLVNATLAKNVERVRLVASGIVERDFLTANFTMPTGIEAFASSKKGKPILRETFGVGVSIVHDPRSPRGYTVISAYPRQD